MTSCTTGGPLTECPVCGIPQRRGEVCPSPGCPCFGLPASSTEAAAAAARYLSGSIGRRNLDGEAAMALMEMRALLDLWAAVDDLQFEHRSSDELDDE